MKMPTDFWLTTVAAFAAAAVAVAAGFKGSLDVSKLRLKSRTAGSPEAEEREGRRGGDSQWTPRGITLHLN